MFLYKTLGKKGIILMCIIDSDLVWRMQLMIIKGKKSQNHPLNLCSSAVKSQRFLCGQKAGMKCLY